jgi:hypothetical protein
MQVKEKFFNLLQEIDDTLYSEYMKGLYFGYPTCCIEYFLHYYDFDFDGSNKNQQYAKSCIKAGRGTGFIPCPSHTKEITKGITRIEDCINNRRCEIGNFPNATFDIFKFTSKYEEYKKIADFYVFNVILKDIYDYRRYLGRERYKIIFLNKNNEYDSDEED